MLYTFCFEEVPQMWLMIVHETPIKPIHDSLASLQAAAPKIRLKYLPLGYCTHESGSQKQYDVG
jgi:hypothetical protein